MVSNTQTQGSFWLFWVTHSFPEYFDTQIPRGSWRIFLTNCFSKTILITVIIWEMKSYGFFQEISLFSTGSQCIDQMRILEDPCDNLDDFWLPNCFFFPLNSLIQWEILLLNDSTVLEEFHYSMTPWGSSRIYASFCRFHLLLSEN